MFYFSSLVSLLATASPFNTRVDAFSSPWAPRIPLTTTARLAVADMPWRVRGSLSNGRTGEKNIFCVLLRTKIHHERLSHSSECICFINRKIFSLFLVNGRVSFAARPTRARYAHVTSHPNGSPRPIVCRTAAAVIAFNRLSQRFPLRRSFRCHASERMQCEASVQLSVFFSCFFSGCILYTISHTKRTREQTLFSPTHDRQQHINKMKEVF